MGLVGKGCSHGSRQVAVIGGGSTRGARENVLHELLLFTEFEQELLM